MWWALLIEYCFIGVFVVAIMRHLKSRNVPYHVLISVWISWTSALSLVALVPIDLNLAYLRRCISHFDGDMDSQEQLCPSAFWLTWDWTVNHVSQESIDKALNRSESLLKYCWLWVFTVCQVNGWILLTFQQSFVEAQHFLTKQRFYQAFKENGIFYGLCGGIGVVFLLILYIMRRDLSFWIGAMLALANAVCLLIVALMLGYGIAEAPKAIFQRARAKPTLRRALYNVHQFHKEYNAAADALATTLATVYLLRKAAGNSLRALSKEIMIVTRDSPFEITSAVLMHPTKGPSIPMTKQEMKAAFITRLNEIEADKVFDYQMTEVDQWIASLEQAALIPRGADVFGIQEALLEAGHKMLSDLDAIDPGHRGDDIDRKVRERGLQKCIDDMKVPGTPLVHRALIAAIIKRNDEAFLLVDDEMMDEEITTGEKLEDPEAWDVQRLVEVRKELYLAKKKYRRSKKKFDHSSRRAVFLQDVKSARDDFESFGSMRRHLWRAFKYGDTSDATGWSGLKCPVRKQHGGPYWLQLEAVDFFWMAVVSPTVMLVASFACAVASLMLLWTELSVFPSIRELFEDSQKGSLLLYHVCTGAATPPGCFEEGGGLPQPWVVMWEVRTWVQWIIIMHLFFECGILYFSLMRLKIFSIYEVVVGETDAFSLLFNAYVVCRLAPSIAHNYLNMLQEAHEIPQEDGTVFEKVFSAMGTIPFTHLGFNEVIPPVVLVGFIATMVNMLTRKCVECPRLDGEAHKTDEMICEAEDIVRHERRKYENRCQLESSSKRTAELKTMQEESERRRHKEMMEKQEEVQKSATKAWGKVKGAVQMIDLNRSRHGVSQSNSAASLPDDSVSKEGDKVAMLSNVEIGGDKFVDSGEASRSAPEPQPGPTVTPEPTGGKQGGPKWARRMVSNPRSWMPSPTPSPGSKTSSPSKTLSPPPAKEAGRARWAPSSKQEKDLIADLDNI